MRHGLFRGSSAKLIAAAAVSAAAVGGLAAFDSARKASTAEAIRAAGAPAPVPVVVSAARREVLPVTVESVGSVVADRQVILAAEVAGRVTAIHFTSGERAEAGEALVQLNDGPLRRELDRRQASANLAAANLGRAERLQNLAISRQDFDQRAAAAEEARALVAQSREEIAQRLVRAPFSGVLGLRRVNLGQYVQAGDALVTLTDTSRLHVDFTVPERFRGALAVGQAVEVTSDGARGTRFGGVVSAIEPLVDEGSRAVRVRATLDRSAQGLLWPGKFARVALALPPEPPRITIPASAVESSISGEMVYVVRTGRDDVRRAVAVPVRVGVRVGDRVALFGGEVSENDMVVSAGRANLRDGATVVAREAAAPQGRVATSASAEERQ